MLSWLVIPMTIGTISPLIPPEKPETTLVAQLDLRIGQNTEDSCAPAVLSRLQQHQIAPGETLESIAGKYGLLPGTLIGINPSLGAGSVPVGAEILIPPTNGIRIQAPAGATWQDLEAAYGVRADVLFEINGCQTKPNMVFLPGVNWNSPGGKVDNYTGLAGYPLEAIAPVGLSYGWQTTQSSQQMFHSGIDLLADLGTPILAADDGIVVFVGQAETYGNLVIIDHGGGRQTRYAHLDRTEVATNQVVQSGTKLGTVGTTGEPDLANPHLHFEVRYETSQGWVAQNPEIYLQAERRE